MKFVLPFNVLQLKRTDSKYDKIDTLNRSGFGYFHVGLLIIYVYILFRLSSYGTTN